MKKVSLGIIIGLLAGAAGAWLFLHPHKEGESEEKKEELKAESHVVHGTNGETLLQLDKEAQERAGLRVVPLEAGELQPEIKTLGRVLDPAPLATAVTEIAAAGAQFDAAGRELQRLKILHSQNQNVSTRAVEAAEAAAQRDRIAAEAAQLRLLSTWGKSIAEERNLNTIVHQLASQEAALVRVDVPPLQTMSGEPKAARIRSLSAGNLLPAEFVGPAASVDAQTLGRGFLFLVRTNNLAANAVLDAWLSVGGEAEKGAIVPRDAIVRHEGEAFVYVQNGGDRFVREKVELEHPVEKGWFVDGLKPGTRIVIAGAQQLLSEELKGEGGGE
jgi:hypothetical protein